jgi:hypothetical protein
MPRSIAGAGAGTVVEGGGGRGHGTRLACMAAVMVP